MCQSLLQRARHNTAQTVLLQFRAVDVGMHSAVGIPSGLQTLLRSGGYRTRRFLFRPTSGGCQMQSMAPERTEFTGIYAVQEAGKPRRAESL